MVIAQTHTIHSKKQKKRRGFLTPLQIASLGKQDPNQQKHVKNSKSSSLPPSYQV